MDSSDTPFFSDPKERIKYENRQHITRTHLTITSFLIWILSLTGVGFLLFKNGFLLSRKELSNKSTFEHFQFPESQEILSSTENPPKFKKAIIVLIDAFRYDFAMTDLNADGSLVSGLPYRNQMPFLRSLITDDPDHAILFEFIADAPTTTLQRIKGLTTGSLPTFIDAGSNFAGTEILEDSWMSQITNPSLKRRIAFLGDDTWLSLFPKVFNPSYDFPSFDVWDLHTVDDGILANFDDVFYNRNASEPWDMLITHFLGVDHCGHRYGPDHPQMGLKLKQMDDFIKKLNDRIDDDTVVFVFGDHGMDRKGDHGGDSDQEVEAGLLVFSKKQLRDSNLQRQQFKDLGLITADDVVPHFFHHKQGAGHGARSVQQIDLVPTISLLLGLPIPFNSLGMIIPELFLSENVTLLIQALQKNVIQVHGYLSEYALQDPSSEIAHQLTNSLKNQYDLASEAYLSWVKEQQHPHKVLRLQIQFLRETLTICRALWAQFDLNNIYLGLILLFSASLILCYHALFRSQPGPISNNQISSNFSSNNGPILGYIFAGAVIGAICGIGGVFAAFNEDFFSKINLGDQGLFGGFFGSTLGYWVNAIIEGRNNQTFSSTYIMVLLTRLVRPDGWFIIFNLTVLGVILGVPISVWMAEHEDTVIMWLLQGFVVGLLGYVTLLNVLPNSNPQNVQALSLVRKRVIKLGAVFLILNQMVSHVTVCREEQHPHCKPTFYDLFGTRNSDDSGSNISTTASSSILGLYAAVALILPLFLRQIFHSTRNFYTSAPVWIEWGFRGCLFSIVVYWVLDSHPYPMFQLPIIIYIKNLIIRVALGVSIFMGIGNLIINPVLFDVQLVRTDAPAQTEGNEAITSHSMVVLGFGNGLGAPVLLFISVILLPLLITQQPMGGIMLALFFVQMVLAAEILDGIRDINQLISSHLAPHGMSTRSLDFAFVSVFYLLSYQSFFSTGHQATLSSIQWKVGFVGLESMHQIISPTLVTINTVSAFILGGVGVLLIVFWKVTPNRSQLFHRLPYTLFRVALYFVFLHTFSMSCTASLATHHRRHLKVWKVFAPRFLLGGLAHFSGVAALVFLALFLPSPLVLNEVFDVLAHMKQD